MGNNICGIKLRRNKADNEDDAVYMSFREVINSPKRNEVIDLTIKKQRPSSTSTCSIRFNGLNFSVDLYSALNLKKFNPFWRQSSTSGVSSDNDIYDELPDRRSRLDDSIYDELPDRRLSHLSDYDVPRCSTSRLPTITATPDASTDDDYDVPRANWLTDNEDEGMGDDEYDIPRQYDNFDVSGLPRESWNT